MKGSSLLSVYRRCGWGTAISHGDQANGEYEPKWSGALRLALVTKTAFLRLWGRDTILR
jgi:hypothetical protein